MVWRNTVTHGNKDYVPFVALNRFQVLYEQPLPFRSESIHLDPNAQFVDHILNTIALLGREAGDAKRLVRIAFNVIGNDLGDLLGLNKVAACPTSIVVTARCLNER